MTHTDLSLVNLMETAIVGEVGGPWFINLQLLSEGERGDVFPATSYSFQCGNFKDTWIFLSRKMATKDKTEYLTHELV